MIEQSERIKDNFITLMVSIGKLKFNIYQTNSNKIEYLHISEHTHIRSTDRNNIIHFKVGCII